MLLCHIWTMLCWANILQLGMPGMLIYGNRPIKFCKDSICNLWPILVWSNYCTNVLDAANFWKVWLALLQLGIRRWRCLFRYRSSLKNELYPISFPCIYDFNTSSKKLMQRIFPLRMLAIEIHFSDRRLCRSILDPK